MTPWLSASGAVSVCWTQVTVTVITMSCWQFTLYHWYWKTFCDLTSNYLLKPLIAPTTVLLRVGLIVAWSILAKHAKAQQVHTAFCHNRQFCHQCTTGGGVADGGLDICFKLLLQQQQLPQLTACQLLLKLGVH